MGRQYSALGGRGSIGSPAPGAPRTATSVEEWPGSPGATSGLGGWGRPEPREQRLLSRCGPGPPGHDERLGGMGGARSPPSKLERPDQSLHALVVRLEGVLAKNGFALGVVELQVDPV